jgi:hypothetical protein
MGGWVVPFLRIDGQWSIGCKFATSNMGGWVVPFLRVDGL